MRVATKKTNKRIKDKSTTKLRKKLWKMMSEFVRRRDRGVCFTCGDKRNWKEQQAGHYIHKDCLDFNFKNINCQCVRCNKWLSGNLGVYAENLMKKYFPEDIEKLREISKQIKKWTITELGEIERELKDLLKREREK